MALTLNPINPEAYTLNLEVLSGWHDTNRRSKLVHARLSGLRSFAVLSGCAGNQSAQQCRLPGLCRFRSYRRAQALGQPVFWSQGNGWKSAAQRAASDVATPAKRRAEIPPYPLPGFGL